MDERASRLPSRVERSNHPFVAPDEWNVPTNGAYDRRRPDGLSNRRRDGRSHHGDDPPHHRRRHRPVPHRPADRARRGRGAAVPRCVRDLRPRQRHVPGRGARRGAGSAPHVARPERAVDGHGRDRVREGEAAASDHGRHELDRTGGVEHGHRGGHRAREPPARAPALRRHVREPCAGPGAPAGGAVRGSERHGERRLPAGDPLLGPDRAPGAAAPVPPPGRGDDARSRGLRAGLPRPAAGRAGGGVRLPGRVLRAAGAPDPAAGTRSGRARAGGGGPAGGGASAPDRRRRRPLLPRDRGARGVRRAARRTGRGDGRRQVVAPVGSPDVRRPDRGHGEFLGERPRGRGRRGPRGGHAPAGLHDRLLERLRRRAAAADRAERRAPRRRQAPGRCRSSPTPGAACRSSAPRSPTGARRASGVRAPRASTRPGTTRWTRPQPPPRPAASPRTRR